MRAVRKRRGAREHGAVREHRAAGEHGAAGKPGTGRGSHGAGGVRHGAGGVRHGAGGNARGLSRGRRTRAARIHPRRAGPGCLQPGCIRRDDQAGAPGVLALERLQDDHRSLEAGHGHGVGRAAQRRGDRLLGSVLDGHQGSDRAEHPAERAGVGEQGPGCILAAAQRVQALAQGVPAGPQGRPLGAGFPLSCAQPADPLSRGRECGAAALVLCGQPAPVVVPPGRDLLLFLVLLLGPGGTGARRVIGLGQPACFLAGRGRGAAGGFDPAAQPGQPLGVRGRGPGPGRGGAGLVGQPPLFSGQRGFGGGALRGHRGQLLLGRLQPLAQHGLLLAQAFRFPFQLIRVPAGTWLVGLGGQVGMPFLGQAGHAADPLGQRGQAEPGLLRSGQPGCVLLLVRVQRGFPLPGPGQILFQGGAPGQGGCLVGLVPFQRGRGGDVVVGEQPQPGIPQVGLDDRGTPGQGRLAAQRLEAAPQLSSEVDQPGQVDLHRLELAERFLLAAAVLEHPGRLLDQRPPGLRAGVQHLIQLTLPDDDVHLTAQAGVGQQFLHVKQPAVIAVDGVLALPGPEQQAADGDLGVFDRQRAIAVVDGQGDFGAAERRPGGGPGEDHVLHLAAPQGLHALLAHDPGEGVHHVRLAGPVRADDAGDAGLEAQRGGGCEGLEPAQGECLQIHLRASSPPTTGRPRFRILGPPQLDGRLPPAAVKPGDMRFTGRRGGVRDELGVPPPGPWPVPRRRAGLHLGPSRPGEPVLPAERCGVTPEAHRAGGTRRAVVHLRPQGEARVTPRLNDDRDAGSGVPGSWCCYGASGKRRFTLPISNEQRVANLCSQRVVPVLEPDKLSLQITYSLLKAAHLRDHAGIRPADVA